MTLTPNFLPVGSIVNPISGDHRFNKPLKEVYCRIVSINETSCEVKQVNDDSDASPWKFHLTNIAGIPLTPEILTEWCNAKKWGRDDMPRTISYDFGFIQIFPANSFCDFEGYGFMHYKPNENELTESARVVIHYLHELQLLFLGFKTVLPITIK